MHESNEHVIAASGYALQACTLWESGYALHAHCNVGEMEHTRNRVGGHIS